MSGATPLYLIKLRQQNVSTVAVYPFYLYIAFERVRKGL